MAAIAAIRCKSFRNMDFDGKQAETIVPQSRWSRSKDLRSPAVFSAASCAVRLARAADELELAALHLLFEDTELRLLLHVEHLVDRIVRFARIGLGPRIDLLHRLDALFDLDVVGLSVHEDAT